MKFLEMFRQLREKHQMPQLKRALALDIDTATYHKKREEILSSRKQRK
ncbi:MAG: hypothetical protein LBS52_04305 [Dysgonamonadaceae bacterium]|jgi:hypothetical protein|nr:hypothetical protein [Dysgonamonadaceae bacterium]